MYNTYACDRYAIERRYTRRCSGFIVVLFDIFEISIDHRWFAFTTRSKYNSHSCLHFSYWLLGQEKEKALYIVFASRYKVNYGAGHMDDCPRD